MSHHEHRGVRSSTVTSSTGVAAKPTSVSKRSHVSEAEQARVVAFVHDLDVTARLTEQEHVLRRHAARTPSSVQNR